ncbi:hypothetical protein A2926_01370 [Candidatus Giovannonibacteria bacterium RIFCSPLOWO2_01_FULL_44_40]|uniref:SpoVR protein-like N-terminal domain-containing protein n=1 Tax=Candidatus Giovannonibacteria bacterium RIFCSPHIGHO2_01_FULL_45_23 TaxID=1798325 RepID=A0A1F5VEZ9_9BACT|nr:MAG: hypothetical protein A2834_01560 [Candidatus Giovannonibacteria bacterium RIFCSPHIGHO2_01_FULL_45_23]OGF79646.1 MAG: hypothetical protein A2926_01370 [Candidatus Giovannonibacteria bacterium RIFCSPLOWO2_01_FULL_44_40]
MELIDQKAKKIMEECKAKAKEAGLSVKGETLEYILTNQNMIELSPKRMIPTLYDYWVHDVEVIRDKWVYGAYPHNPYETCINTRPGISFYNDNNPDWLNCMIFYHVLGHLDFFQNNIFFRNTWNDDFCGEALADKRLINRIREELGAEKRWVDYVIEFARGADNLVGFYAELEEADRVASGQVFGLFSEKANFYFGEFLKQRYNDKNVELKFSYDEVNRYNRCLKQYGEKNGEMCFFEDIDFKSKFPEFPNVFKKRQEKRDERKKSKDILQYLMDHSEFINKDENKWMKDVIGVVRRTSLYFQPQIRTKIANEGWASVWHERLFMADERMRGHEIDFASVNAGILVDRRLGLNPYILGKRLFEFIEELAKKGKLSYDYQLIKNMDTRKRFDQKRGDAYGTTAMLKARENFDDFMLINFLSDDDFQDFVIKYDLFIAGQRFNKDKMVIEVYIKSRDGKKYRKILNDSLYHSPYIVINHDKAEEDEIYLDHVYEGRSLYTRYIPPVLTGLAYLAGKTVKLETTEFAKDRREEWELLMNPEYEQKYQKHRVLYTCREKNFRREVLSYGSKEEH